MQVGVEAPDLIATSSQRQIGALDQISDALFQSTRALIGSADAAFSSGPRASRPSSGLAGDRYYASDIGTLGGWEYLYTGTVWEILVGWASGTDAQRSALTVSATDNGAWFYASDTTKFWEVSGGIWVDRTPAGAAGSAEPYVTIGNTAGLSAERALVGTANQITLTDGGAGAAATLSIPANAILAGLIVSAAGRLAVRTTTPAQIVANTNNYAIGTGTFHRITTDASRNITGIVAGVDGDILILKNAGSFDFVLTNLDGSSSAANQIDTGTGGSVTYAPSETAMLIYDITSTKWVLIV